MSPHYHVVFLVLYLKAISVLTGALRILSPAWTELLTGDSEGPMPSGFETAARISQGENAPKGRFPYMCSLRRTRGEEHVCGGTLIHKQWVLTAAHCVDPKSHLGEFSPLVHIGGYLIDDPDAEVRFAEKTILHCGWSGNILNGNDIALIELQRPCNKTTPRMATSDLESFSGEQYHAIGWGKTGEGEGFAEKLRILGGLQYLTATSCNGFEVFKGKIDERMMCCIAPVKGDTCQGDSGGPLIEVNNVGNITEGDPELDLIVGVTSHGPTACRPEVGPGVYTRIAQFREWIDRVIDEDGEVGCEEEIKSMPPTPSPSPLESIDSESRIGGSDGSIPSCTEDDPKEGIDEKILRVEHLSGAFASRPSCLHIRPNRTDCFLRSPVSEMVHIARENDSLIAWETVPSFLADAPECVSLNKDHMNCFVPGVVGPKMWSLAWTSKDGFEDWRDLGQNDLETPSCVTRYGTNIVCFIRGRTNSPYAKEFSPSTGWGKYLSLTGIIYAPFSCGSYGGDIIDCMGAASHFELHHTRYEKKRGWRFSWSPMGINSRLRPKILHPSNTTVEAFVVTFKSNLAHARYKEGSGWSNWTTVDGTVLSEPECVAVAESKFHCFAIGLSGRLMRIFFNGKKWLKWQPSKNRFLSEKPSCLLYNGKEIRCYLRDYGSGLAEVVYTTVITVISVCYTNYDLCVYSIFNTKFDYVPTASNSSKEAQKHGIMNSTDRAIFSSIGKLEA